MNKRWLNKIATACFLILCAAGIVLLKTETVEAVRYYSDNDLKRINGTYYHVDTVKKVTYSSGKLSITGKLRKNQKLLTSKKRTFKVAKKVRVYGCDSGEWEYIRKISKKTFARDFNKYCKEFKTRRFPSIHFWIKKGTIVAYAVSA